LVSFKKWLKKKSKATTLKRKKMNPNGKESK